MRCFVSHQPSDLILALDYRVQLDTGSSDLWIKGASSPLPNSSQTVGCYLFHVTFTAEMSRSQQLIISL